MSGANTDTSFCISKVDAMQMQTAIYVTHLSSLNVERDWLKSTKTGVRKAFNLSFRLHFQCLLIARLEINTCNEVQSGLQVSLQDYDIEYKASGKFKVAISKGDIRTNSKWIQYNFPA